MHKQSDSEEKSIRRTLKSADYTVLTQITQITQITQGRQWWLLISCFSSLRFQLKGRICITEGTSPVGRCAYGRERSPSPRLKGGTSGLNL
jgi:hypothetical protein